MRKFYIVLAFIVFGFFGFFREFSFFHINNILYNKNHVGGDQYPISGFFTWLNNMDAWSVYYWKWASSFIFILLFFLMSVLFLKKFFPAEPTFKWLLYFYGLGLILTGSFLGLSVLNSSTDYLYRTSLLFSKILESPVPIMILAPVFILKNNLKQHKE